MKISYHWLKEFLSLSYSAAEIAEKLTQVGLEVENISCIHPHLDPKALVVGTIQHITHCTGHHTSYLQIKVSIGKRKKLLHIVCGASKLAVGERTCVALVGAALQNFDGQAQIIQSKKVGNILSAGMLCSAYDIGLGKDQDDILRFDSQVPDGTSFVKLLTKQKTFVAPDEVFEVALTPNRGDAASHLGVARELAILFHRKLKRIYKCAPALPTLRQTNKIRIEAPHACPKYLGMYMTVKVKSSPLWLQQALRRIGHTPLNNIVDITNYVMYALGQPLHAFDAKVFKNQEVVVREAARIQHLRTLDGKVQTLQPADLLICAGDTPVALAGIIGGEESKIHADTRNIFVECAYFEPTTLMRSAKRLALQTEASFRYTRGTDPSYLQEVLQWTCMLLQQYADARPSSKVLICDAQRFKPKNISFSLQVLRKLAGTSIPKQKIKNLLQRLDIDIRKEHKDTLQLRIPHYRVDVCREIDVCEEILRFYGYQQLTAPFHINYTPTRHIQSRDYEIAQQLALSLTAAGFMEIVTNPLIDMQKDQVLPLGQTNALATLHSHSAERMRVLRPSLLASGAEVVSYNLRHRQQDLRLFEYGKAYAREKSSTYKEEKRLALYMCGARAVHAWREAARIDFYDLFEVLQRLCIHASLHPLQLKERPLIGLSRGIEGLYKDDLLFSAGTLVHYPHVFVAEIYVERLFAALNMRPRPTYHAVLKSPEVRRDLSLILPKSTSYAQIEALLHSTTVGNIKDVRVFSVFEGDPLPKDSKSYALSFVLQEEDTLSEAKLVEVMQTLMRTFEDELGAIIRK